MPRINSEKPFYATLEAFVSTGDVDGYILVKKLPSEFMEQNVYDVVQKLLETGADEMNDAYNSNERETAETIKGWFKDAERDPKNYGINVRALDKDNKEIPLGLEDRLNESKYASIIKTKMESDPETNAQEPYRLVDLMIDRKLPNGTQDTLDERMTGLYGR